MQLKKIHSWSFYDKNSFDVLDWINYVFSLTENLKILSLGRNNIKNLNGLVSCPFTVHLNLNKFSVKCNSFIVLLCSNAKSTAVSELLNDIWYTIGCMHTISKWLKESLLLQYIVLIMADFFAFQEAVAETLEELWISYNSIEKLKGIGVLKKLKVRYTQLASPSSLS